MTENAASITANKPSVNFAVFNVIIDWSMQAEIYKAPSSSDKYRLAVLSTLLKTGAHTGTTLAEDLAIGYTGNYVSQIGMKFMYETLGTTSESTTAEIESAFKTWVSNYNNTHDVKFDVYYKLNTPTVTDITDTEAGQALLALVSQNGAVYTNSENADMKVTYNRDINKALEDVLAAGAAAALESDYRLSKMELGLN